MSNTRPNLIFEPRFHPKTSARDLASLTNALARLKDEEQLASGSPNLYFRGGTLILALLTPHTPALYTRAHTRPAWDDADLHEHSAATPHPKHGSNAARETIPYRHPRPENQPD